MKQKTDGNQGGSCQQESAHRNARSSSQRPTARGDSQQHGAKRRNKAQRQIAAVVEQERTGAREQVQEPDIERLAEIAVHIPVRCKAGEEVPVPVVRHSHGSVVEIGVRRRVQCPCQPVGEENPSQRGPLPARTNECKQKGKGVTKANLGQRVLEGEVGDGALGGAKKDSQRHQQETAPDGMAQHALEAGAFLLTASQGVWKRNPDQEGEGRLDHVVEAHPRPLNVGLVVGQKPPKEIVWERKSYVCKLKDFPHHQEHDQAPVSVDCNISLQLLFYTRDRFAHSQILHAVCFISSGTDSKEFVSFDNRRLEIDSKHASESR